MAMSSFSLRIALLASLTILGCGLQGCAVVAVAGAAAGVAGTAVGATAKVTGAAVRVTAGAIGAAGRTASGGSAAK